MKRLQLFSLLLLAVVAFGCTKTKEQVVQTFPDGKPREIQVVQVDGESKQVVGKKQFYANGNLEMVGNYDATGKKTGLWKYFYEDGTLWIKSVYKNDLRDGAVENFYKTGQLRFKGQYNEGEKTGLWEFYTDKGEKAEEKEF